MRCFIALWPPPELAEALDHIAADLNAQAPRARRMARGNLHLTLAFIGELGQQRVDEVASAMRALALDPFDWQIDHVGSFRSARVAWAGGPADDRLLELAARVRQQLTALGVAYDPKPFVAHVTLVRQFDRPWRATPIDPLIWPVDRPMLAQSERDARGAIVYRRMK